MSMKSEIKRLLREGLTNTIPIELRGRRYSNVLIGRERMHTSGTVRLADLIVLPNGIETAKNKLATDTTFKPSKKPIVVGVDIKTGSKQLLDGYHRYVSMKGNGTLNAYFIPMSNGDIIDLSEII
jgi:hypothetical protein